MVDLSGVCVPICTPFTAATQQLDETRLLENIDSLLESKVDIIGLNCGTSEFPFLSEEEKRRIVRVACKHIDGRAKVITQSSALRTEDAVDGSKYAQDFGADAVLVLPPYFEGPREDGVFWHYERIAESVSLPIMVYNIPVYTQFDITPDIFKRLSEMDNIQYIKDSTGDAARIDRIVEYGLNVFCGCDHLGLYAFISGAKGVFSGSGNAIPGQLCQLRDLVAQRDIGGAVQLWRSLAPFTNLLWRLPFNPAAKYASGLSGRPAGDCRRPVMPLTESEMQQVKAAVDVAFM